MQQYSSSMRAVCNPFSIQRRISKKPLVVLETGVSDGISTLSILLALEENQKGSLYSIDFPDIGMPKLYGKPPGWIIPPHLKKRWCLIVGKSSDELKPLLNRLKCVDVFFHDSEHSYINMMREFETVHMKMTENSCILSDDASANSSIADFAISHKIEKENVVFLRSMESDLAGIIL